MEEKRKHKNIPQMTLSIHCVVHQYWTYSGSLMLFALGNVNIVFQINVTLILQMQTSFIN